MCAARRASAAALVLVAAVSLSVDLEAGKKVKPGDTYQSRTKLFQVAAPKGCSSVSQYEIEESSRKGPEPYEEVVLRPPASGNRSPTPRKW